jgi:hypothetical protein
MTTENTTARSLLAQLSLSRVPLDLLISAREEELYDAFDSADRVEEAARKKSDRLEAKGNGPAAWKAFVALGDTSAALQLAEAAYRNWVAAREAADDAEAAAKQAAAILGNGELVPGLQDAAVARTK